jgi:hypothetical protein
MTGIGNRAAMGFLASALLSVLWGGCSGGDPQRDPDATGKGTRAGSEETASTSEAIGLCGNAGQTCCATKPKCATGLECNGNNICRTPCGGATERCCTNQVCDPGLGCNANGICHACGASGDICCAGNTCNSTSGQPLECLAGRCTPCGGPGEKCCGTLCETGLICDTVHNQCDYCGSLIGEPCCPGATCYLGTCNISSYTCQ